MKRIYLDNNSTTPLDREVKQAIIEALDFYGNPSSHHEIGKAARKKIEQARENVAAFINAEPNEIIFTSGASESNNIVLKNLLCGAGKCCVRHSRNNPEIITSKIEHPSVTETCKALECSSVKTAYMPVSREGIVNPEDLRKMISTDTALVSVMFANNETGTIQPVKELAEIAHSHGIPFHTDAVQAAGKIKIDVKELGVDYLSISGHKMYAPKGIGILYVKKGAKICPLISGGHQETGLRAGTENTLGIVAIGKAAEIAMKNGEEEQQKIVELRDRIENGLLERIPHSYVNGDKKLRVPNTLNMSFDSIEGEAILYMLDHVGIEVSTGSACSSGSLEPSSVLVAMGLDIEKIHSSIRISLGKENTQEEADYVLENFPPIIEKLRKMSPFSK